MSTLSIRFVALLLAVVTMCGIFADIPIIQADTASASVSQVSVSTQSDNYYIVTKDHAAVRQGTTILSKLYGKQKKNTTSHVYWVSNSLIYYFLHPPLQASPFVGGIALHLAKEANPCATLNSMIA